MGVAHTTWPFLIGAVAGMVVGRIWRRPTAAGDRRFRLARRTDRRHDTALRLRRRRQLSFVIVAGCVLGVFLVGWRAALQLIQREAVPRASSSG